MKTQCLFLLYFFAIHGTVAFSEICNPMFEKCWLKTGSSSSPAYPSKSTQFKINPSAVPVEKGFGIETILFSAGADFSLVKGLGRVGAAISPTANQETFFGPPGFELPEDYLARMREEEKYQNQVMSLASAFSVYSNKSKGLKRFQLNLGIMGKYNRLTHGITPGGGLSVIGGPFTAGFSMSQDQSQIKLIEGALQETHVLKYQTQTFSGGIFLNSVALDYSHQKLIFEDDEEINITLITGSIILRKWILTLANRKEESDRLAYDFKTRELKTEMIKYETFGGVQFSATKVLMLGIFHNYYLMRELSAGITLFF